MELQIANLKLQIESSVHGFVAESIVFEGEGDFCRAYTVNHDWLFRFAHNIEGSRSLGVETELLPRLAEKVRMPIPNITYSERQSENGYTFVAYPRIAGVELASGYVRDAEPSVRERYARDLGHFLSDLHSFDVGVAQSLGVVRSDYPFSRTEEGITDGTAAQLYWSELERLLSYPILDESLRRECTQTVEKLLDVNSEGSLPEALVHGDLSQEHMLFDPQQERITGVIDFTDVLISTPLLDFMYLYHAYGEGFLGLVLGYYRGGASEAIVERTKVLHRWYMALRLLWALDHDYAPGIERGLRVLKSALGLPSA